MPATIFDVYVFDFDGTLVQSAEVKRKAFFDIFEPADAPIVDAILTAHPDASRSVVIPMMLDEIERRAPGKRARDAAVLVSAYGNKVDALVAAAEEVPGAGILLRQLATSATVYVASMTPQAQLRQHLERRGWHGLVTEAFGYPADKTETVATLIRRHRLSADRLLVVGDGTSDEQAARLNGCRFHRINRPADLMKVAGRSMAADV